MTNMNEMKMKRRVTFGLLLFFLFSLSMTAQERRISGVVTDAEGQPIIGANVMVKGTVIGAATDLDGNYTLEAPSNATTLQVSYIGMRDIEVPITGTVVNITMEEDVSSLDELIVIGYGTVRKRDLTGSVASVRGESIKATPVTNVAQALQGKLAGVNVISQDGRPDASFSIRVRGGGSISQSNEPLVLIDGIQGNIGDIPADMIESIDVLKDASSTAIYGARGANGVILITTRRGKEGKASVSYSGYAKFNRPTGYLETLAPYDYLSYKWGLLDTYFGASYTEPFQQLFGLGSFAGSNSASIDAYKNITPYDLQKEVYNSSFSHNHDLTVTAGTDKTKVIFGLNYTDEDGMKLNSYFKRATASFKLDQQISKNLDFNLDVRYTDRESMGNEGTSSGFGSSLSGAYRFRPIAVEDMKGDRSFLDHGSISGEEKFVMYDLFNPVAVIKDHQNLTRGQYFRGTTGINWTILDGLSYRTELTLARNYAQNQIWRGPTPFGNEESYLDGNGNAVYAGDADYRKSDGWNMRWSNTLNYARTLNDIHRLNFLAGQELTSSGGSFMRIEGERYPANFSRENAFAMISQYGANLVISSGVTTPSRILSYFGRANYSLMDKYIFTVTFRADGSSTFSPEHRWGYFPAVALAWRVSEEPFLKDANWLEDLKVRASYGEVGNDAISADQWSQLWAASSDTRWQYGLNNEPYPSYDLASDQMANRDLKWETTITRNIGLDFTVLNNRMWGTIDLYKNTTKDLLMLTDIPSISGFNSSFANIGQTSNKGLELSLSGILFKNSDWNIAASGNINFNKGNIDQLAEGLQSAYGTQFLQSGIPNADYALLEGRPVGIVMGLQSDGKGYYTTDDFNFDAATGMYSLKEGVPDLASSFVGFHGGIVPAGQYAYPGMPKFKDVSGGEGVPDGVLDEKDYEEIGSMVPLHTGGFNVTANYRNIDLGIYFNWSYGNDIYNANKLATLYNGEKGGGLYGNKLSIVNDTYKLYKIENGNLVRLTTPDQLNAANANTTLPLTYLKQGYVSNIGIEDGSYLRLNTVTLGYTLPKQLLEMVKANNIRLYGSIYNVFTLTGYSGLDPEVNTQQNANNARYPTPGFDWGTYPRSRQFVFGINATF